MNKACAVYRDGSKLSQPLMSQLVDSMDLEEEDDEESVVEKMVEEAASAHHFQSRWRCLLQRRL